MEGKLREKVLLENGVDIRDEWSFMYPGVYNLGRKPMKVDWRVERVFKKVNGTNVYDRKNDRKVKVDSYFVIPKGQNSNFPFGCRKGCQEIVLKK